MRREQTGKKLFFLNEMEKKPISACSCIYVTPAEENSLRAETLESPQDPARDPSTHQPEIKLN